MGLASGGLSRALCPLRSATNRWVAEAVRGGTTMVSPDHGW